MGKQKRKRGNSNGNSIKILITKLVLLLFCGALLIGAVISVDRSTSKMMMSKDDKEALGLRLSSESMLLLTFAGEVYAFDITPIVNLVKEMTNFISRKLGAFYKTPETSVSRLVFFDLGVKNLRFWDKE